MADLGDFQDYASQLQALNAERQQNLAAQRQNMMSQANQTELLAAAGRMAADAGGPIQGRPIQFKAAPPVMAPPSQNPETMGQAKFKNWMSNVFNQQKEENLRREKEYTKREWALSKSINKIMSKISATGHEIAETMNPKNIGTTFSNQFKILMTVFGLRFLARNFELIVNGVTSISKGFTTFLDYLGLTDKGRRDIASGKGFRGDLIEFFAGPKARTQNISIVDALGTYIKALSEHIKLYLEKEMEIRGIALKKVKFPDIKFDTSEYSGAFSWVGDMMKDLSSVLTSTFKGLGVYLGDVATAMVDPKKGIKSGMSTEIKKGSANRSEKLRHQRTPAPILFNEDENEAFYAGDGYAARPDNRYLQIGAVDEFGDLRRGAGNSISQGQDILGALDDTKRYGHLDVTRVAGGLQRLYNNAKKGESVVVDRTFIDTMYGGQAQNLISSGAIKAKKMKLVKSDATDEDHQALRIEMNKRVDENSLSSGARTAEDVLGATLFSTNIPYFLGTVFDVTPSSRKAWNHMVNSLSHKLVLVPESDPRPAVKSTGKSGIKTSDTYYELSPAALQWLAKNKFKIANGEFSSDNYATFLPGVENWMRANAGGAAAINRRWQLEGSKSGYFDKQIAYDYNKAFDSIREITGIEKAYDDRLSNDPFMQITRNQGYMLKNGFNNVLSGAQNAYGTVSGFLSGKDYSGNVLHGVTLAGITDDRLKAIISRRNQETFWSTERGLVRLGFNAYKGLCTAGPSTFYEAGGINIRGNYWWGGVHPSKARTCYLEKGGLSKVWNGNLEDIDRLGSQQLRPGDIGVLFGCHKKDGSPSAHGMMWDGKNWVSDTVQSRGNCYGRGRLGNQSAQIFRYLGFWGDGGDLFSGGNFSSDYSYNGPPGSGSLGYPQGTPQPGISNTYWQGGVYGTTGRFASGFENALVLTESAQNNGSAGAASKTFNPGNYKGSAFSTGNKDSQGHAVFTDWVQGYAAAGYQLLKYISGDNKVGVPRNPTLRLVHDKWTGHNDQEHLANVCKYAGMNPDDRIPVTFDAVLAVMLAICKFDSDHCNVEEGREGLKIAWDRWIKEGGKPDGEDKDSLPLAAMNASGGGGNSFVEEAKNVVSEIPFVGVAAVNAVDKVNNVLTNGFDTTTFDERLAIQEGMDEEYKKAIKNEELRQKYNSTPHLKDVYGTADNFIAAYNNAGTTDEKYKVLNSGIAAHYYDKYRSLFNSEYGGDYRAFENDIIGTNDVNKTEQFKKMLEYYGQDTSTSNVANFIKNNGGDSLREDLAHYLKDDYYGYDHNEKDIFDALGKTKGDSEEDEKFLQLASDMLNKILIGDEDDSDLKHILGANMDIAGQVFFNGDSEYAKLIKDKKDHAKDESKEGKAIRDRARDRLKIYNQYLHDYYRESGGYKSIKDKNIFREKYSKLPSLRLKISDVAEQRKKLIDDFNRSQFLTYEEYEEAAREFDIKAEALNRQSEALDKELETLINDSDANISALAEKTKEETQKQIALMQQSSEDLMKEFNALYEKNGDYLSAVSDMVTEYGEDVKQKLLEELQKTYPDLNINDINGVTGSKAHITALTGFNGEEYARIGDGYGVYGSMDRQVDKTIEGIEHALNVADFVGISKEDREALSKNLSELKKKRGEKALNKYGSFDIKQRQDFAIQGYATESGGRIIRTKDTSFVPTNYTRWDDMFTRTDNSNLATVEIIAAGNQANSIMQGKIGDLVSAGINQLSSDIQALGQTIKDKK